MTDEQQTNLLVWLRQQAEVLEHRDDDFSRYLFMAVGEIERLSKAVVCPTCGTAILQKSAQLTAALRKAGYDVE
jgi:hypothetical protein